MSQSDHQYLFLQLKAGSEKAFEDLYCLYKPAALKFCTSIIKDAEEAESIVQDVFMRLWDRRSKLNTDCEFKSYLFSSLRNGVFDYLREVKKNEKAKQQLWDKIESAQKQDENEEDTSKFDAIQKAVNRLPQGRKEILRLRFEEGKSYEEISTQLNISSNTVKNQLIKAKKYLKDLSIYL